MTTTHEAAERWRKHNWGGNIRQYGLPEQAYKDMLTLSKAYSAEHDPTDADIGWLNGLSRDGGDMGFMAMTLRGDKFHLRCGEGDGAYVSPKPATRGAVRMFCRALGIELREQQEQV